MTVRLQRHLVVVGYPRIVSLVAAQEASSSNGLATATRTMNNITQSRNHHHYATTTPATHLSSDYPKSLQNSSDQDSFNVVSFGRWSPPVDPADATAENAATLKANIRAAQRLKAKPRPLFPWRSAGLDDLLPRITPGTTEFRRLIALPTSDAWCAWFFLNQGFWSCFVTDEWKRELERGMTYAFTRAVAGIVSNTYRVPLSTVLGDAEQEEKQQDDTSPQFDVSFTYPPPSPPPSSSDNSSKEDKETESNGNNSRNFCPEIPDMMRPELRRLFQAAHESGVHQLRIRLQLVPVRTYFHRLYCLPFLTRHHVTDVNTEVLQEAFLKNGSNNNDSKKAPPQEFYFDMNSLYSISMGLMQQQFTNPAMKTTSTGSPVLETTVAAEVLIICQEVFSVWDAETGELVQGYDGNESNNGDDDKSPNGIDASLGPPSQDDNSATTDAATSTTTNNPPPWREVAHLVTFEQTVGTREDASGTSFVPNIATDTGNWQIADIDDLLGPQKWFHVVLPDDDNNDETKKKTDETEPPKDDNQDRK
eukprot:CAMPEP_0168726842 /NCGR_PEP_ID=MMETSP0724-20121128/4874_1 /TAXON_ID=265536 /ORGANISM="Amphiprora sp., Strain CCMP467" /LENGTH=533 /DNA_ID=CAMNT_0008773663 /DNA_START=144 /DNA_END=1746 /DNA_ORIENTATION=+